MSSTDDTVVPFPAVADPPPTKFEKIWGKRVRQHGYTAVPNVMVRGHRRLGVNATQFCILVQLLEHYWSPDRPPFPTKQQLADRIGVSQATIKANMKVLEDAKLIRRVQNKTAVGDWGANTYHLDGLIQRIKEMEPDFEQERQEREQSRQKAETPKGLRRKAPTEKRA